MLNTMALGKRKIESLPASERARHRLSLPLPPISRLGALIPDRWKKTSDDSREREPAHSTRHPSTLAGCMPLPSPTSPGTSRSFDSARSARSHSSLVTMRDALYPPTPTSPGCPSTPKTPPILQYPTPILARSHSLHSSPAPLLRWDDASSPSSPRSAHLPTSARSVDTTHPPPNRFSLRPSSLVTHVLYERDEDDARRQAHKRHNSAPILSGPSFPLSPSPEPTSPTPGAKVWLCSRPPCSPPGGTRQPLPRPVVSTSVVRSPCDISEIEYIAAHRIPMPLPSAYRCKSSDTTIGMCSWDGTSAGALGNNTPHLFPAIPVSASPASSAEGHYDPASAGASASQAAGASL